MGDIRPRRSMDMGRPSGAPTQPMPQNPSTRPLPQAPVQQAPIQRPQPLPPRPQPQAQRPVTRPARYGPTPQQPQPQFAEPQAQQTKQAKVRKERPFWRGFLQVIVSLLVIVGVASIIVALYFRYYQ